jgi:hypothetical protein
LLNVFDCSRQPLNSLYTEAGQSTAAFDPRQFQLGLRLRW